MFFSRFSLTSLKAFILSLIRNYFKAIWKIEYWPLTKKNVFWARLCNLDMLDSSHF